MKTPSSRRASRGFTLIELLVVISIISVLAAAGFAAASAAMNKTRKVESTASLRALESAIDGFYSEYSRLPSVGSTDEIDTSSEAGKQLLVILLGKEDSASDIQNKRGIGFLSMKEGKAKKGGIIYNSSGSGANSVNGAYDAWGNPFRIILDNDYDEEINDPFKSGTIVRNKKVLIYTVGQDKKQNTADDVKSW